jgi:hypothetical protein
MLAEATVPTDVLCCDFWQNRAAHVASDIIYMKYAGLNDFQIDREVCGGDVIARKEAIESTYGIFLD